MSTETWRKVMAANLDGAFFCMRAAARQMIAQGGNGPDHRHLVGP